MEVERRASFVRDIRRIRDATLLRRTERIIQELEAVSALPDMTGVSIVRSARGRHYRIRIGEHRLGFSLEGDTVILVRFMHRREIYRRFP